MTQGQNSQKSIVHVSYLKMGKYISVIKTIKKNKIVLTLWTTSVTQGRFSADFTLLFWDSIKYLQGILQLKKYDALPRSSGLFVQHPDSL